MKYLTVSARCTKRTCDLLAIDWDEEKLGEPTDGAVLEAIGRGLVEYEVVDEDEEELASVDGVEVLDADDE